MNQKYFRIFAVIILILVIVLLAFDFFRSRSPSVPNQGGTTPPGVAAPTVNQAIPYTPQRVNVPSNVNYQNLPKTLPVYSVAGDAARPFTSLEISSLASILGFKSAAQIIPGYGGGSNYMYGDAAGRTLIVKDAPPSISYSEPPATGPFTSLPSLDEASSFSLSWFRKLSINLPDGWEVRVIKKVYISGEGSSAVEVPDVSQAGSVSVNLGYFYGGLEVYDGTRGPVLFSLVIGPNMTIISAKSAFLVTNSGLAISPVGNVAVKDLAGIENSFSDGSAKAISLGLSGVITDEPILNPPQTVDVKNISPVLLLSGKTLYPYFSVSAQGTLSSGRTGEVQYLVPAESAEP
ncbi:MAG: hypothetical protein M1352_01400 [Patescibacteria group bacterium]|nr:hypothetical protein [Patescibacteria group bacterium]